MFPIELQFDWVCTYETQHVRHVTPKSFPQWNLLHEAVSKFVWVCTYENTALERGRRNGVFTMEGTA